MKTIIRIALLLLCLSALPMAGCASSGPRDTDAVIGDADIEARIREGFLDAELRNWNRITIRCREGIVQLSGTVSGQEQYEEAIRVARSVSGVKRVEFADLRGQ